MSKRDENEMVKLPIHVEYSFDGEVEVPLWQAMEIWEDRDSFGKTQQNIADLYHLFEHSLDISDAEITDAHEWSKVG